MVLFINLIQSYWCELLILCDFRFSLFCNNNIDTYGVDTKRTAPP